MHQLYIFLPNPQGCENVIIRGSLSYGNFVAKLDVGLRLLFYSQILLSVAWTQ